MADEFDFWNDHSIEYLGMAYMWDRRKKLENPDGFGEKTGDCGDTITMYLDVKDGLLRQLCFELDGCINTNACTNVVALNIWVPCRMITIIVLSLQWGLFILLLLIMRKKCPES